MLGQQEKYPPPTCWLQQAFGGSNWIIIQNMQYDFFEWYLSGPKQYF